MPKVIADDDDKVVSLSAMPADWDTAPSAVTLNAGTDWSMLLLAPFDLDATDSDRIPQRAIGEPTNTETFGKRNAAGTLDYFRSYVDGQPDAATDLVHEAAKVTGTVLYLARREGGKAASEDFAAGDEISIWEVVTGGSQAPKEDGYRRGRVPLAVRRFEKNIIVAA